MWWIVIICSEWRLSEYILAIDYTHWSLVASMCWGVHADHSLVVSKTTMYYSKERKRLIIAAAFRTRLLFLFMRMQRWASAFKSCGMEREVDDVTPRAAEDTECVSSGVNQIPRSAAFMCLILFYSSCCSSSPVWGRLRGTTAAWLCWWKMTGKSLPLFPHTDESGTVCHVNI